MINDSAVLVKKMQMENEQGDNIIRTIQLLAITEADLTAIKNRIKAYGNIIQNQLNVRPVTSPATTTTSITLSNDIKVIQRKLDKMKLFAQNSKDIVKQEKIGAIARITDQIKTLFNNQQSNLQLRSAKIETTIATKKESIQSSGNRLKGGY